MTVNTLAYNIEHCSKIAASRRKKVINILDIKYNIRTWNDLMEWRPTWNYRMEGLTENEVRVLAEMRTMQKNLLGRKEKAKADLYCKIAKYAYKHETSCIFNILVKNRIDSIHALLTTPDHVLANFPGIGKKRLETIGKIRLEYTMYKLGKTPLEAAAMPLTY